MKDLERHDGLSFFEEPRAVIINAKLSRRKQDETLVHELLHVAYNHEQNPNKIEERVITRSSDNLLPILRQFGFQIPRRPRGVGALERRARAGEDEEE